MKKLLRITTVAESLNSLLKDQLEFLNQYYEVIGVASGSELLKQVSEREGIRTINVPMERRINLRKDFYSLIVMIKIIRIEKPYIIHANTPKGSLIGMVAAWICRVPHRFYTVTGLRFETATGCFRKLLILMEKITCSCATKVIPEGDGVANTLRREKITRKPLKKILNGNINGINSSYFDATIFSEIELKTLKSELGIEDNDFVFIFIGRLVKDKGVDELISAFSILAADNCKLILVGSFENDLDPLFPETLQKIKNNNNIIPVGYQDDVRPYLAISNSLVFPSHREGFPNVVIQAGAMGLPSIVTDINGCNEIIIEGENGMIIPPKNTNELLKAMQFFLSKQHEVKRMATNARQLIVTRYEQKAVWEALLTEYRRLEEFEK